jgi:site-specific DNA recombinase
MLHLPPLLCHTGDVMRAALYARVSTERQGRDQTIDSQLTALQAWAAVNGHVVGEDHIYRDEGLSGSRLDRSGLDPLGSMSKYGRSGVVHGVGSE